MRQCVDKFPEHDVVPYVLNLEESRSITNPGECSYIVDLSQQRTWECAAGYRSRIKKALNALQPDLLVFNEQVYAGDLLKLMDYNLPAVNVVHSHRDEAYPHIHDLLKLGVPQIAVSKVITENILESGEKNWAHLVHHLPLGVSTPEKDHLFPWHPKKPLEIVYVGRLVHYQKRVLDLPPLLIRLKELGVLFKCHVIGDGSERTALQKAIAMSCVAKDVQMHGALPHNEVLSQLKRCHVFLLVSDSEGLPISMLEGMAHGNLPIVPQLPSGISEVICPGVNGQWFRVGRPEEAAQRLFEIIQHPDTFTEMRKQAIQTARTLSIDRQMKKMTEVFRETASISIPDSSSINRTTWHDYLPKCLYSIVSNRGCR